MKFKKKIITSALVITSLLGSTPKINVNATNYQPLPKPTLSNNVKAALPPRVPKQLQPVKDDKNSISPKNTSPTKSLSPKTTYQPLSSDTAEYALDEANKSWFKAEVQSTPNNWFEAARKFKIAAEKIFSDKKDSRLFKKFTAIAQMANSNGSLALAIASPINANWKAAKESFNQGKKLCTILNKNDPYLKIYLAKIKLVDAENAWIKATLNSTPENWKTTMNLYAQAGLIYEKIKVHNPSSRIEYNYCHAKYFHSFAKYHSISPECTQKSLILSAKGYYYAYANYKEISEIEHCSINAAKTCAKYAETLLKLLTDKDSYNKLGNISNFFDEATRYLPKNCNLYHEFRAKSFLAKADKNKIFAQSNPSFKNWKDAATSYECAAAEFSSANLIEESTKCEKLKNDSLHQAEQYCDQATNTK